MPEPPAPTEEVARRLLQRARVVFSALTFGYRFRYAPGDGRRGINEEFELQPVAEFAWGDARLRVLDTYVRDNLLYSQLRYELSAAEQAHRGAWASNRIPLVGGTGTGNRFLGEEGRREALQAAVRSAIRDHLSAQISKPREIRGDVLIWQPPATVEDAGRYHTTVQVKLFVTNVVPHRVY